MSVCVFLHLWQIQMCRGTENFIYLKLNVQYNTIKCAKKECSKANVQCVNRTKQIQNSREKCSGSYICQNVKHTINTFQPADTHTVRKGHFHSKCTSPGYYCTVAEKAGYNFKPNLKHTAQRTAMTTGPERCFNYSESNPRAAFWLWFVETCLLLSCNHTRHQEELNYFILWTSGRYLGMVKNPNQGWAYQGHQRVGRGLQNIKRGYLNVM